MKRLVYPAVCLVVAAIASTPLVAARAQDKPPQSTAQTPATAKDAKPGDPTSVEGQWHLTMPRMGGMAPVSVLEIKMDGKKFKGSITSPSMGEIPIKGEFSNNKIKFSLEIDLGAQTIYADFDGKLKDGELSGTVSIGPMGEVEWKATRPR